MTLLVFTAVCALSHPRLRIAGLGRDGLDIGHDGMIAECNQQLEACLAFCAMPPSDSRADATEASVEATEAAQD